MKLARIPTALLAMASLLVAPAVQSQRSGLVSVELSEVAQAIAQRHKLDEALMPLSIQVPAEVAAAVCGASLEVMVRHASQGGEGCVAKQASPELGKAVADRMKTDEEPPTKRSGAPRAD